MVPPYRPECMSAAGPVTSTCRAQIPRSDISSVGTVSLHWPPSAASAKSQASSSRWELTNPASCGLPISSWPSSRNLMFTGSAPAVRSSASTATIGASMLPLSSEAPRA